MCVCLSSWITADLSLTLFPTVQPHTNQEKVSLTLFPTVQPHTNQEKVSLTLFPTAQPHTNQEKEKELEAKNRIMHETWKQQDELRSVSRTRRTDEVHKEAQVEAYSRLQVSSVLVGVG